MTMGSNKVFETERLTVTISPAKLEDHVRILDIGGGGEGVISKIYKHKVVAIDQRYDELSEILDTESLKLVMDATKLEFVQEQFERATAFYSYMYMSEAEVKSSISEVYRVLKDKGLFEIWDVEMPSSHNQEKEIFIAQLEIKYDEESITTGYGVRLKEQKMSLFSDLLVDNGFTIVKAELNENHTFYIEARK